MNVQDWKQRIALLPCIICTYCGITQDTRTTLHHPRKDKGLAQRASDWLVVPLCWEHHMGKTGIEGLGIRAFERRYALSEMELLAMTLKVVTATL